MALETPRLATRVSAVAVPPETRAIGRRHALVDAAADASTRPAADASGRVLLDGLEAPAASKAGYSLMCASVGR